VRRRTGATDWSAIERLYDALDDHRLARGRHQPRHCRCRNARPAAGSLCSMHCGRCAAAEYQPYWAARAGLLGRVGDLGAADAAYERAIGLESDPAIRRFLQLRRSQLINPA
jgi:RNA polymerase sigma-70 factor (ECF subfamily)